MQEIWKDIKGYEGLYKVSNYGKIISIRRNKIMGFCLAGSGYEMVQLYKNKKPKPSYIHRLVYENFIGELPNNRKMVIDHVDNNKRNNFYKNLQLITNRRNCSKDQNKNKTSSRFIGVRYRPERNKWSAEIRINGKKKFIGNFDCELAAAKAYKDKLKEIS